MTDNMTYSLIIFLMCNFVEAPGHVPSVPSPKSGTDDIYG